MSIVYPRSLINDSAISYYQHGKYVKISFNCLKAAKSKYPINNAIYCARHAG
jgi:hypothetical protein